MDDARFEELVAEALDSLPDEFLAHLENVEVVIEEWPSEEELADAGLEGEDAASLLGLYFGIPLTERGGDYAGVLPDRITLYQGSILAAAGEDPAAIREEVCVTVVHEVAHFYGISDDRLE
ncbi:MAG TPA: metallopeptidase family protein, partial [Thermoleophilia bacterium]|nr:metallopeptidase family protein [Thermoleophilia bacterium]